MTVLQYKGKNKIRRGRQQISQGDYCLVVGQTGRTTLLAKVMYPDVSQEDADRLMGDLNNAADIPNGTVNSQFEVVR